MRLRTSLESIAERDFIIIDTGADLGYLLTTVLIAADMCVNPGVSVGL